MAKMHRAFFGFDDAFYEEHTLDDSAYLGRPCSGGTVANLEALWAARNSALAGCDANGVRAISEGVSVPHHAPVMHQPQDLSAPSWCSCS